MICDGWWEKRDYFFGGLFSAFDLDSLIPIFLSNCSLALFTVLVVLSAHKILVVAVNLKLKLSMLILYEAMWFEHLQKYPISRNICRDKGRWRHLHARRWWLQKSPCRNIATSSHRRSVASMFSAHVSSIYSSKNLEFSKPILRHRSLSAAQ